MDKTVLLSDLNSFYASVEELYNPYLRSRPVAICGRVEDRHGIVLAANPNAKRFQIRTGDAVWQARAKCPPLTVIETHMERYVQMSKDVGALYREYSPCVEPFGLDESYIDLTGVREAGEPLAQKIRQRLRQELGITASIGVSFNRVFAKLASDMRKPDAVTEIGRGDYRTRIWPLPVSDLLYVGRATTKKLIGYGIRTIGDLACADPDFLRERLGVCGYMIWQYANGDDDLAVSETGWRPEIKSIGNSTTTPRDLTDENDIRLITTLLAESVAERMRDKSVTCRTVQVWIRYKDMASFQHQTGLAFPCSTARSIGQTALELILRNRRTEVPIRSLGVRACRLLIEEEPQLSLIPEEADEQRQERLESTVQDIRKRFGHFAVQKGMMLTDRRLTHLDTQQEASAQSIAFFKGGC